mmetsp:Transcript_60448/g.174406  ORF Transcript_60448/g.174406 Transcript_60448/m.174406 type:complete len:167 (+) Transcript_60448:744-1244(+)
MCFLNFAIKASLLASMLPFVVLPLPPEDEGGFGAAGVNLTLANAFFEPDIEAPWDAGKAKRGTELADGAPEDEPLSFTFAKTPPPAGAAWLLLPPPKLLTFGDADDGFLVLRMILRCASTSAEALAKLPLADGSPVLSRASYSSLESCEFSLPRLPIIDDFSILPT